jgi:hypothetical protein
VLKTAVTSSKEGLGEWRFSQIIFIQFKKKRKICLENSHPYYNFAKTLVGKQNGNSTFLSRWDARL